MCTTSFVRKILALKTIPRSPNSSSSECKKVVYCSRLYWFYLCSISYRHFRLQCVYSSYRKYLHKMKQQTQVKYLYLHHPTIVPVCNECNFMRLNTLENLYNCLLNETPEIQVGHQTKSRKPILVLRPRHFRYKTCRKIF